MERRCSPGHGRPSPPPHAHGHCLAKGTPPFRLSQDALNIPPALKNDTHVPLRSLRTYKEKLLRGITAVPTGRHDYLISCKTIPTTGGAVQPRTRWRCPGQHGRPASRASGVSTRRPANTSKRETRPGSLAAEFCSLHSRKLYPETKPGWSRLSLKGNSSADCLFPERPLSLCLRWRRASDIHRPLHS